MVELPVESIAGLLNFDTLLNASQKHAENVRPDMWTRSLHSLGRDVAAMFGYCVRPEKKQDSVQVAQNQSHSPSPG